MAEIRTTYPCGCTTLSLGKSSINRPLAESLYQQLIKILQGE